MSTIAPIPEYTDLGSWWRRLRFTPVSDLCRGHLTGRLGLPYLVNEARLPAPLPQLVLAVVRRTRLWLSEKREVARELISHFQEGLDAGASPDELARAFGDAGQAARLIRRAKKRSRPRLWRAGRAVLRGMAVFIGAIVLLYALQTARFYLGSPTIRENYTPRLNVIAASTPPSQHAWPLYRSALIGMPQLPNIGTVEAWKNYTREPGPGEPGWEVIAGYLAGQRDRLAEVRAAAAMPVMGRTVGFDNDDADRELWPSGTRATGDFREHSMFEILLPHLMSLRRLAMVFSADIQRAASEGDGATVAADVTATLGIAGHVREQPIMICDLVSIACVARAVDDVLMVLDQHPECLKDEDLVRLAHRLGAFTDDRLQVRLDSEEWAFADFMQRTYTDDGSGDGRLTPAGVKLLGDVTNLTEVPTRQEPWVAALAPGGSIVMLGRREMTAEYGRLINMYRAEADTPLWLRGRSEPDQVIAGWAASPLERLRHLPLVLLFPAVGHASVNAQLAMLRRDAALLVIALELHRRRHGTWPASQADLVPTLLPAEAVDRFDGRPMRFVIRDGRPVVYSVGVDRDDDGGNWPLTVRGTRAQTMEVSRWLPAQQAQENLKVTMPNVDGVAAPNPSDGDWILFPPYHDPYPLIPPPNPDGS